MEEPFKARVCALLFCRDFDPIAADLKGLFVVLSLRSLPGEFCVVLALDNGNGDRSRQAGMLRVTGPDGRRVQSADSFMGWLGDEEFNLIGCRLRVGAMFSGSGTYLVELVADGRTLATRRLTIEA